MNRCAAIFIVMVSVCALFAKEAELSPKGISEREVMNRSTAHLSASLLIGQLRESFAKKQMDSDLYRKMIKNPEKYADSTNAASLLTQDYSAALQSAYREEAQKLLDSVKSKYEGDSHFYPPELVSSSLVLPVQYVQENIRTVFPAVYKQARERAYSEQRAQIVGSIYPTEEEVDTLSDSELIKKLENQLLNEWSTTIFEENRSFVRNSIVAPIVNEALSQRQTQMKCVEESKVSDLLVPSQYELEMFVRLNDRLERRRNNPSERKVYNIFPSVRSYIPRKAKELTVLKFTSMLTKYLPDFSTEMLLDEIVKNPATNRTLSDSEKYLYNLYKQRAVDASLEDYLKNVPRDQQLQIKTFLENNAINGSDGDKIIRTPFDVKVVPEIRRIRELIANAQLKRFFPQLESGDWQVPDNELMICYGDRKYRPEERWRSLEGLTLDSALDATMLEETGKLVTDAVTASFEVALKSLDRQMDIVQKDYSGLTQIFKNVQRDGKYDYVRYLSTYLEVPPETRLTEENIAGAYIKKVFGAWDRQRIMFLWPQGTTRPKNYEQLYKPLFPIVVREIERHAKSLFNELEISLPEEYGEGNNHPELKVINCNVEVNLNAGGYTLSVSSPQNPLMRQLFSSSLDDGIGMNKVGKTTSLSKMQDDAVNFLLDIVRKTPMKEKNFVQIFIRVGNENIPYGFISSLREAIREELGTVDVSADTRFRVLDELKLDMER